MWHPDIERLTLSGTHDRGDIGGFRFGPRQHRLAWELKNRSQLALPQWVREAQTEAKNYDAVAGAVCFKRKGKASAAEQFVLFTLEDFLTVLRAAAT